MSGPVITEIDVRGTGIRVMRAGAGEPLVVLRGSDASDDWRPWLEDLTRDFDVIVPEHPGFGGRPRPGWLDRVADLALFYLDLFDALGLERAHLVGTSLGGWIAADIAVHASHRLASLTLVGAAGLRVAGPSAADIFMLSEEDALRARFHDGAKAAAEIERMLAPDNEDIRLSNAITIARVAWQPRLHDPHLAKWLHRIATPTLVVWGEHDRVLPPAHAEAYTGAITGARKLIVPACGHWVAHERPDRLVAAIREHVSHRRRP